MAVLILLLAAGCQSTAPSASVPVPGQPESPAAGANHPDELVLPDADPESLEPEQLDVEAPTEPEAEAAETDSAEPEAELPPEKGPEELLTEAFEAYDSATIFLDEGLAEDALAALDHAYELLLELPGNGESDYIEQKEDLRQLVAEQILEVYASRRTAAGRPRIEWDLEIPIVSNQEVQREIKSFQTAERKDFLAAYQRSGLYRPMILEKLEEAELPSQLSWLPLIESAFKTSAYSRASAVGLWQFIRSTGTRYGLRADSWVEDRKDPERSTDAAIAYLIELHDLFGDWPKALAGYNCGEHRVLRLDRSNPNEDLGFWDFYNLLPRETRRYVPRFFATLLILGDPEQYGFELPELLPPLPEHAIVQTTKTYRLQDIDTLLGLPAGTLQQLNPSLRQKATPNRPHDLKVPVDNAPTLLASLDTLKVYTPPQPEYIVYRVRRGDTLSRIAQRYGTSTTAIARLNGLRNRHRIGIGQRLKVPVRGGSSSRSVPAAPSYAPTSTTDGTHTVRRGDTLYAIAKRYGTTVARLKSENNLSSTSIFPGQKLKVHPGSRTGLRTYTVRRGDTLGKIAQAHRVSLSSLLRVNGLSSRSTIYPGQVVAVPD